LAASFNFHRAGLPSSAPSPPHTEGNSDRNNQGGYQHPILDLNAKDVESLNKHMQGVSSDRAEGETAPGLEQP
jgi:hypothetical protein